MGSTTERMPLTSMSARSNISPIAAKSFCTSTTTIAVRSSARSIGSGRAAIVVADAVMGSTSVSAEAQTVATELLACTAGPGRVSGV